MASVYADPKLRSKRNYIATSSFNNQLYTYTVTKAAPSNNFTTTGALGATTNATAANCPQGRILRESGIKLYPQAHPGISTMMVKVFDANSGLSGYIDPNAPIFAVYNSDKPVEIVDGGDNNTTTVHKGQPVYTTGDVIAGGNIVASGLTSQSAATTLTAAGTTRADALQLTAQVNNLTTVAASTGVILPTPPAVGSVVYVMNSGANTVKIYANGSQTIDGTAGSTGTTLVATAGSNRCAFFYIAANTWVSAKLGAVSS